MFRDSSGFPFCLVRNLVQCLFTSLWIVLWWWLYAIASLTLCSFYLCLCCDGIFCEDLLSAVVNLLLLRLTIVSVMLGC